MKGERKIKKKVDTKERKKERKKEKKQQQWFEVFNLVQFYLQTRIH